MIIQKLTIILIITLLKLYLEDEKNIIIYETNNNYPRPLRLRNGEILAFSGYEKGTVGKYNIYAEEIKLHVDFIAYDANADIKEVEDNKFVLVSGKNDYIKIHYFNSENFNCVTSFFNEEMFNSTSYKINILTLNNNKDIIISWVNNNILYMGLFILNENSTFSMKESFNQIVDNNFISCIQMKLNSSNGNILCQYITDSCTEYYDIYSNNFQVQIQSKVELYKNYQCAFDKVINLIDSSYNYNIEKGASCFLHNNFILKCIIWEYNISSNKIEPINFNNVYNINEKVNVNNSEGIKIMDECFNWVEETEIAFFDNNKFIGTCLTNETDILKRKVKIAIVNIIDNLNDDGIIISQDLKYSNFILDTEGVDFPFATKFGNGFLSVFFNVGGIVSINEIGYSKIFERKGGNNSFEIFDSVLCKSQEIQINYGNFINFNTKDLIYLGTIDPINGNLNTFMYPIYFEGDGELLFNVNNNLENIIFNQSTDNYDFTYYSNGSEGYKIFTFSGIDNINRIGIRCNITIKVCSKECLNCEEINNNSCTKCSTDYHQLIDSKDDKIFPCYKDEVDNYLYNETTGYYEKCYDTCKKCIKPKNYSSSIGTILNNQCIECKDNYYFQSEDNNNKIGDCVKKCDENLALDSINKKCINCKLIGLFHIKGIEECKKLEDINELYYIIKNDPYNNVDKCLNGKIRNIDNPYECVNVCNLNEQNWYIDYEGKIQCTNGLNCNVDNRNIIVESNQQCVFSCRNRIDSYCDKCLSHDLFLFNNKCLEDCPNNYDKDYNNNICIPSKNCHYNEKNVNDILIEGKFENIFNKYINNYIINYENIFSNEVEILKGNNYTIEIFKSDYCEYQASSLYNISYVNLTQCQNRIISKNNINSNNLIFIKIDFPMNNESDRVFYQIYNSQTKEIIDLNSCKLLYVDIEMFFPKLMDYKKLKDFYNKGILLYNPSDNFFNDFCIPYYINNKDVLLKDRRIDFFLNYSFCDEKCFPNLDFENNKIYCRCQMKYILIENTIKIYPREKLSYFPKNINKEHIDCLQCFNLVFHSKYSNANFGKWIFLIFLIIYIVCFFIFYFKEIKDILSFIIKYKKKKRISKSINPNPPKKEKCEKNEMKNKNNKLNSTNSNSNNQTPNSSNLNESSTRKLDNKELYLSDISINDLSKFKNLQNEISHLNSYDDLNFEDASKLDKRPFSKLLCRTIIKKNIFISPFIYNYLFEPYSIRFMILLFQIFLIGFFINLFFEDKFIRERYKTIELTAFKFTFKQMGIYCFIASIITSFIVNILYITLNNNKEFINLIHNKKDTKQYMIQSRKLVKKYKIKLIIVLSICFFLMIFFWYYISTFCGLFVKTQNSYFICILYSIIFSVGIQTIYSILLSVLRYFSLKNKIKSLYNIIQILI